MQMQLTSCAALAPLSLLLEVLLVVQWELQQLQLQQLCFKLGVFMAKSVAGSIVMDPSSALTPVLRQMLAYLLARLDSAVNAVLLTVTHVSATAMMEMDAKHLVF